MAAPTVGPIDAPDPLPFGEPVTVLVPGSSTHKDPGYGHLSWAASGLPSGLTLITTSTEDYPSWPDAEITGTPDTAGTGTATITATDGSGVGEVEWEWTVADPDPGTPPTLADELAPRVLAMAGWKYTTTSLALATAQVQVVTEFVRGYTRGRGWPLYYAPEEGPEAPLRAVIISATTRLLNNPAQVTFYAVGDYSERPSILEGFTLAERAVLNNYRKKAA